VWIPGNRGDEVVREVSPKRDYRCGKAFDAFAGFGSGSWVLRESRCEVVLDREVPSRSIGPRPGSRKGDGSASVLSPLSTLRCARCSGGFNDQLVLEWWSYELSSRTIHLTAPIGCPWVMDFLVLLTKTKTRACPGRRWSIYVSNVFFEVRVVVLGSSTSLGRVVHGLSKLS
jgi:hypothetical protein